MVFHLMRNDRRDRDKEKQWSSLGGKGSVKEQECSQQILTRAAVPKKLASQIFSPANLNVEK